MILEGIVTTLNPDGEANVAPMGPAVDEGMTAFVLRPFKTSLTYRNLRRHPQGVLHVIDDVLLLAQSAIGRLPTPPACFPAERIEGVVLEAACRWYEFRVTDFNSEHERTELQAQVVHTGRLRDFFGFNRARHAVVEAAILATRVHLLPPQEILDQFAALRVPVEKTAGPKETEAFELLYRYVSEETGSDRPTPD